MVTLLLSVYINPISIFYTYSKVNSHCIIQRVSKNKKHATKILENRIFYLEQN